MVCQTFQISCAIFTIFAQFKNFDDFPNALVEVFIELPQTDAGTRCAGICAASIALADAGITMKDMVAAVSTGIVDGQVVVDLDYAEEAHEEGKER